MTLEPPLPPLQPTAPPLQHTMGEKRPAHTAPARPGRPRHRSPATSPLRTEQQPARPARDVAPRKGSQPTGRPPNAVVAPSSPTPRELPPVPPSPADERVASSSHRAPETESAKTELTSA